MTGEMSQFDADHDQEWALHRSIARAIGGTVRAFDVYQGPYIQTKKGRLWIIDSYAGGLALHLESSAFLKNLSPMFYYRQVRRACRLARNLVA